MAMMPDDTVAGVELSTSLVLEAAANFPKTHGIGGTSVRSPNLELRPCTTLAAHLTKPLRK